MIDTFDSTFESKSRVVKLNYAIPDLCKDSSRYKSIVYRIFACNYLLQNRFFHGARISKGK